MTIKELQDELSRIKRYYQMTGEDAEVMDKTIHTLEYIGSLIEQYENYIEQLDKDIQEEPRNMITFRRMAQMGIYYKVVSDLTVLL